MSVSQRAPPTPDGTEAGTPVFHSYVIHVSDRPDEYTYRVELIAPDGARHAHDGVIDVKGNMMGGETCKPTSVSASLIVDGNGQLSTQSP